MYYTVEDKNITEMQTVGYAVSDAGIRAPLYWFHAAGYFEEFLGHKKGENCLFTFNWIYCNKEQSLINSTVAILQPGSNVSAVDIEKDIPSLE